MSCEACSVSNTSCSGCNSPKASQPSPGFGVRDGGFRGDGFRSRIGGFPFNRERGFFQQPVFYTQPYFYQRPMAAGCAQLDQNLPVSLRTVIQSVLSSGNTALRQQTALAMTELGYPLAAACLTRGY